jgi:flagellar basal-body rod protein FlgB
MTIQNIGIFNGMHAKMEFHNKRQEVLAQNIANSDTPQYQARDLKDVDFSRFMGMKSLPGSDLQMKVTNASHRPDFSGGDVARFEDAPDIYEEAPDANGVVIEEQLFKASNNALEHQTMVNLYRRNMGMLQVAIRGSGG